MIIGITLGFLIGVITAVMFAFLMKLVLSTSVAGADAFKIIGQLTAIPTFWFGGPWLGTKLLQQVQWQTELEPYTVALAITFIIVSIVPLVKFIARIVK